MTGILGVMLDVAGPRRRRYVATLWAGVAGAVLQALTFAAMVPLLLTLGTAPVDTAAAWAWAAAVVILAAADALARTREIAFQYDDWGSIIRALRLRIGEQLRRMPQQELERRASGDLSTLVGGNVAMAGLSISAVAVSFVQIVVVPVLTLVVVLVWDWRLGVVLLVVTPLAVPFVGRIRRRSRAGFRRVDAADAAAASRVVEYVQGLPVFKATGQLGRSSRGLRRALHEQGERMSEQQASLTVPSLLAGGAVQLGVVAMAVVGAALVVEGDGLSPLLLLALVAAAVRLAEPLAVATTMTALFEISGSALERVHEVLDSTPLPADPHARITAHDVELDHVAFGYAGGQDVLRDVSFTAAPGSLTALVGPSGSGKTTVTRLLTRYADPRAGAVRIGGTDLAGVDPTEIHRHVSVVFQDVYLFDDTIRANIALGRSGATDAEVDAAARAANVHEFVARLPRGYDTRVGEIGGALSGGERQRISIARAILKDASIVLLDEPTAALDAESETAVQGAIDALVADRTVLVVAHRLSTVVAADQILVLDGGRIVERGTHGELLDADGRYRAMWTAQNRARHWTPRQA